MHGPLVVGRGGSPADVRPVGTTGSPGPRPGVPPRRFHAQQRPSAVPGARFEECKAAAPGTGRCNGQTGELWPQERRGVTCREEVGIHADR